MIKTLTKHGNSYALVVDKAIMELLRISPDTPLDITTDGQALIISPVKDANRKAKFEKALAATNRKFGRALRRLAE